MFYFSYQPCQKFLLLEAKVVPMTGKKSEQLKKLQKEILDLQGFRTPLESERRDTGLGVINEAFPNNTFPVSAVHEFISQTKEEAAAACGFMAGVLSTLMKNGNCLWVNTGKLIFPPALRAFGIAPDQVIFVNVTNTKDILWVIEEGLKCDSLAAVVGEVQDITFTESRRLQLAVEKSHTTGFIHRNIPRSLNNIACVSRWKITPFASVGEEAMPGVGFPCWKVELSKIRNGRPGTWKVQWMDNHFKVITAQSSTNVVPIRRTG